MDEHSEESAQYPVGAKRVLQFMSLAFAIAAVLAILVLPSYVSVTSDSDGHQSVEALPLLAVVEPWYLAVLAIPVIIASAPLAPLGRGWPSVSVVSAVLLSIFGLLGALSIGFYFLPAVVVSLIAAVISPRSGHALDTA